ncbi:MAG: phosphatase PAP2 family protein [Actinobacteria bacterium]|nr:phosphatase PAP2 family protein [Actinomycetota bacterium]
MNVAAFDDRVDRALEPLRNARGAKLVFSAATALGDFGLAWHLIGLARAIGSTARLREALWLSGMVGIESLLLNQGLKRLFRRTRPTERGDGRFVLRKPRTSSFPSGHASSAFFSSIVLTALLPWPLSVACFVLAAVIATSRVAVRIHHASDVVGGIVAGSAMGAVGLVAMRSLVLG